MTYVNLQLEETIVAQLAKGCPAAGIIAEPMQVLPTRNIPLLCYCYCVIVIVLLLFDYCYCGIVMLLCRQLE